MREITQPRPFDLDEPRDTSETAFEACESAWLIANGKTRETMTPADVAAVARACAVHTSGEHAERTGPR